MEESGPLTKQIAASVKDVKALLDDNRSLSIAYLARRIKDFEEETRQRFRANESQIATLRKSVEKLENRLDLAGTKYKELREELDVVKGIGPKK